MSNVMTFPVERALGRKSGGSTFEAAIVLFPGVRVERHPFDLADRIGEEAPARPAVNAKDRAPAQ